MSKIHGELSVIINAAQKAASLAKDEHAESLRIERQWEQTLSAVSSGEFDSTGGLIMFASNMHNKLHRLQQELNEARKELAEARAIVSGVSAVVDPKTW